MADYTHFICGSFAGMLTSCLVQPLDVVKTNVLTLNHPMSISNSIRFVYKQYGMIGFWRGLKPAGYKALCGSGLTFYLIESLKSAFPPNESRINQVVRDSLMAVVYRTITCVALSPLSVIKVRMEAPQANAYKSVYDGMIHIYTEEGVRGYYRGLGPALLRDLPFSAMAFSLYNQYKRFLTEMFGEGPYVSMASGGLAGFTATLITQPFDIIKTRNQFSHIAGEQGHNYKNTAHAFRTIYQQEGLKGFATGLNIRIVERTIAFSCVWFTYETCKKYVIEYKTKE